MLVKTQAIVLRTIAYSESSVICKMYTRDLGLRSYLINGVRKPKAKISLSMLQPLSLLTTEVYEKNSGNLQRVKEVKCEPLLMQITQDFRKRSVAFFLDELFNACLLEEEGDEALFDFLKGEILQLENGQEVSNFPILFMLRFARALGIEVQGQYSENSPYFDLDTAHFTALSSPHCLGSELSQALYLFMLMDRDSTHLNVESKNRKELLNALILYFQLHIMRNKELKSVKVLNEVMDAWHTV